MAQLDAVQRKRLAMLRIERDMPEEFEHLDLRCNVNDWINPKLDRYWQTKYSAPLIFRSWKTKSVHLKWETLQIFLPPISTVGYDKVRDAARLRIARRLKKEMWR